MIEIHPKVKKKGTVSRSVEFNQYEVVCKKDYGDMKIDLKMVIETFDDIEDDHFSETINLILGIC